MFQYVTTNLQPIVHNDTMEGRDYIVAPTQMITEGVHNGSDGPIFYPASELAKITDVWNQKPVVVYHPEVNGISVSACSPEQITARKVGVLMNTKWDGTTKKLGTETWLDSARIQAVDNRVAEAIENNEMMEVSTGLFMDLERTEGEWNGEKYIGIARNMQPDHLALLPDVKGACSIEDGAGFLRLNQAGDVEVADVLLVDKTVEMVGINLSKGIRALASVPSDSTTWKVHVAQSYLFDKDKWDIKKAKAWVKNQKKNESINALVMNELSHDDIRSLLYSALRESKEDAWIDVVNNDNFIYEDGGKLYKQNYTVGNNQVGLEGLPKLVEKQVTYKEVTVLAANKSKNSKKGNVMDKKKTVDALIANMNTAWAEEHRDMLMALEDDVLNGMLTPIIALSEKVTELSKPVDNEVEDKVEDKPAANVEAKPKTMKQYIDEAPAEIRESLQMSVNTMNAEKTRLVNVIIANAKNTFTEEYLKTKSVDELKGIAVLAAPKQEEGHTPPMFLGQGEVANQGTMPEPLLLPTMNSMFETAKN